MDHLGKGFLKELILKRDKRLLEVLEGFGSDPDFLNNLHNLIGEHGNPDELHAGFFLLSSVMRLRFSVLLAELCFYWHRGIPDHMIYQHVF